MKDLRIFQQEELVEDGVFHREEEAKGFLKKLRNQGTWQACIENSISNFSGGCVYLYAAVKAYMGLISIGSVVRYASSIIKCRRSGRCVTGTFSMAPGSGLWKRLPGLY